MPRFFFNVTDGKNLRDDGGTELPDACAARIQAVRYAGSLISDEADSVTLGADWHMDVTDVKGSALFRLDFHVADTPAARDDGGRLGLRSSSSDP